MNFKNAIFSLILSVSGLVAVDLGNFEYLSAKYRPYFHGKQIFSEIQSLKLFKQEPRSFIEKYDPLLAQGVYIVTGVLMGYMMPEIQKTAEVIGVLGGIGVGIAGSLIHDNSNSFEHKRYSSKYSRHIADYKKIMSRFDGLNFEIIEGSSNEVIVCNTKMSDKDIEAINEKITFEVIFGFERSTIEEYNVLSRYPKKDMVVRDFGIKSKSNFLAVAALSIGSLMWLINRHQPGPITPTRYQRLLDKIADHR